MNEFKIAIIAAMDENGIIGKDGKMPWSIPAEMKYFTNTTMGNIVLMGRRTYESLQIKPLPGRINMVLSRDKNYKVPSEVMLFDDLSKAENAAREIAKNENVSLFVIGGRQLFQEYLPKADLLYLSKINARFEGDTKFPDYDPSEWEHSATENFTSSEGINISAQLYVRRGLRESGEGLEGLDRITHNA